MPSTDRAVSTHQNSASQALIHALQAKLRRLETAAPVSRDRCLIHSGCSDLDRLLPAGGFLRGSLVECLGATEMQGGGVGTFALLLARQALFQSGALVVLDRQRRFYPPAAALLGIDLNDILVIRAAHEREELWALDQALRCPAVAAVWAPITRLAPHDFRRLQIATDAGESLCLLIRSGTARGQPSWSDIQFMIHPCPARSKDYSTQRRLRIELTRCRYGRQGSSVELEIDDMTGRMRPVDSAHETHTLHLVSQLAYPTPDRCSTRA